VEAVMGEVVAFPDPKIAAALADWLDDSQWSVSRKGNLWRNIPMTWRGEVCNVAVFRVGRGFSWRVVRHGIDDGKVWRSATVWPSVREARVDVWEVGLAAALKALEEDAERIPF
jgi:hypothetical protein